MKTNEGTQQPIIKLEEALAKTGKSAKDLANALGVSKSYISQIMHGAVNPSAGKCKEIATALNIPLASLFEGYAEPDTLECPYCHRRIKLVKDEG